MHIEILCSKYTDSELKHYSSLPSAAVVLDSEGIDGICSEHFGRIFFF
jgi:hypothetical protein